MSLNPQAIINSRYGVGLGLFFGRLTPPGIGYRVSSFIAERIASRRGWNLVRAARANQWVVSGGMLTPSQLDERVKAAFNHTARAIYELNHFLYDPDALERLIHFTPFVQDLIRQSTKPGEGTLVVGLHLGNFDLAVRAATLRGLKGLVLTLPEISGGYDLQYQMRKAVGMEIVPANIDNLRLAVERLRAGEVVFTALDRPLAKTKYRPHFFGRVSHLPVHYIPLAIKAEVRVIVAASVRMPDGRYHFKVSEPLYLTRYPDRQTELIKNAEKVLRVAQDYVRQYPEQWSMFFPVWPEALNEV